MYKIINCTLKLLITLIIIGIAAICFAQDDREKSNWQKLYDRAYPKTKVVECTTLIRYKDSRTYYDPGVSPDGPTQYIKDKYLKDKYVKDSAERNIYRNEESHIPERYRKQHYKNNEYYGAYKRYNGYYGGFKRYNWYRYYENRRYYNKND